MLHAGGSVGRSAACSRVQTGTESDCGKRTGRSARAGVRRAWLEQAARLAERMAERNIIVERWYDVDGDRSQTLVSCQKVVAFLRYEAASLSLSNRDGLGKSRDCPAAEVNLGRAAHHPIAVATESLITTFAASTSSSYFFFFWKD